MEKQPTKDNKTFEKFRWTIQNFSKLDSKKLYSETFFLCGHPWRIILFPKGNNANSLSIYLDAGDLANLPKNWSRVTDFKLALINQLLPKTRTIRKETDHEFNAREPDWGYKEFIPLDELRGFGFIVNDTCIIEAEICVIKSEPEVDQAVSKALVSAAAVSSEPIELTDNPLSKEISPPSIGELVDFKGLGKIEKAFVPLLEEVFSWHPSLIDCQIKRTHRFKEWAFTSLGRVLHFLKTKKVKDMNESAFSDLKILWEELETCKFNLSWLEPHIQSALGMKSYIDRVEQVKRMKENVVALDRETEKLKEKLVAAVIDLEIARKDLVKAEESLEERDLDAELGYGGE
ncbi:TRAF-like [Sesbania bispinosa]|nr:TRAF-like [Sesbania bispinosa]